LLVTGAQEQMATLLMLELERTLKRMLVARAGSTGQIARLEWAHADSYADAPVLVGPMSLQRVCDGKVTHEPTRLGGV
jgi:hypothetical protein